MRQFIHRQEGQELIKIALLLPVILAFLGLALDVGNLYVHRRMVQNAADAAASAAGMALYQSGASVATATARYYAGLHGYDNNGTTNSVQVAIPPTSGTYAGNSRYVQVRIQESVTPVFAALVWHGTFQVSATATAGWTSTRLGPPVIVLDEHQCETLRMNGITQLLVNMGNIHVNSDCASAVRLVGSASVVTYDPTTIVGGYSLGPGASIMPPPITGADVLPDPLANLPVPDIGSYPVRYGSPSSPTTLKITTTSDVTLEPGVYYGGIEISGSGNVTFKPGVYIMAGSGLKITGSGRVTGNEVFFYITKDPSKPTGDGAMGSIQLAGSNQLALTPPGSGPYAGVTFFQDRDNTNEADIVGSTMLSALHGIVYMKNGKLNLTGATDTYVNFVVKQLEIVGNGYLDIKGYEGPGWTTIDSRLSE